MYIYTIYRAFNIFNNYSYIGFTSKTLKNRKSTHKHDALVKNNNNKFYNAIRECGWDSFFWEEIYQAKENCLPSVSHTLTVMENYFINEFNSIENGYNTQKGGLNYPILFGKENPMYGKKHREESILLMKLNQKDKSGENNPMYGIKRSEEWLDKHVRGINHPMYGKKHKPESITRMVGENITCDICGKISNRGNYYRWHGQNCKFLKIYS